MPSDCANRLFETIIRKYFILDEEADEPIDTDSGYCEAIECKLDIGPFKKGTKVVRVCFDGEYFYIWLNSPVDNYYRINEADVTVPVEIKLICNI